jgi:hypothetical protein
MTVYFFAAFAGSFEAAEPGLPGVMTRRFARRAALSEERTIT